MMMIYLYSISYFMNGNYASHASCVVFLIGLFSGFMYLPRHLFVIGFPFNLKVIVSYIAIAVVLIFIFRKIHNEGKKGK